MARSRKDYSHALGNVNDYGKLYDKKGKAVSSYPVAYVHQLLKAIELHPEGLASAILNVEAKTDDRWNLTILQQIVYETRRNLKKGSWFSCVEALYLQTTDTEISRSRLTEFFEDNTLFVPTGLAFTIDKATIASPSDEEAFYNDNADVLEQAEASV